MSIGGGGSGGGVCWVEKGRRGKRGEGERVDGRGRGDGIGGEERV